jgi:hypothetical protein
LFSQNPAYGGGNLARSEDRDGHLIEQWLKQVVVGAVHQDYLRRGVFESLGCGQPSKPSANDDDTRFPITHNAQSYVSATLPLHRALV